MRSEPSLRLKPGRLPATVIFLGFTSLFTDVGSEMIFPLLPVFLASLGAAPAFLGLLEGVAEATSSILKLVFGYVSDRTARKKPMVIAGYSIATFVRPLVALATAPWHVLALRVTDRVGKGIRASPRDALIANAAGTQAGRAFGFHEAMDHAGSVIGPLVAAGLLATGMALRNVFWCALIPGVLALASVLVLKEPPPVLVKTAAPVAGGVQTVLPGKLRSYLGILFVFSIGNSSDAFLLLRAKEVGIPLASIPLLWAVFHAVKAISSYLFGDWSDRYPRVRIILAGWLVYCVAYLGFSLATEQWQVWALFTFYGSYYGLSSPSEKALMKDLAPATIRGRAYGFYNFILGVTAIPAGLLTGFLWQTFDARVALGVGAAFAACASIALIVWSRSLPAAAAPVA